MFAKTFGCVRFIYNQMNLQMAYRNFCRQTRTGFSKYKSKRNSRKRYTTNNHHGSIRIVGYVKVIQHRPRKYASDEPTVEVWDVCIG